MKKLILAVLVAALLFTLGSCTEDMFLSNLYTDMEPDNNPGIPDLGDIDPDDPADASAYQDIVDDLADELAEDLENGNIDDRFNEEVAAEGDDGDDSDGSGVNDDDVAVVLDALDEIIDKELVEAAGDPVALLGNEKIQDAALLKADLAMDASGADEIFDNFNETISDLLNSDDEDGEGGDDSSFDSVEGAIDAVFDTDSNSEEDITEMILGLLSTADALGSYGLTVDPDDEEDQTAPGANAGDIAAQALLAGLMDVMVTEVMDNPANPEIDTPEEAAAEIAAALFAASPEDALGDLIPSDALEIPEDGSITDILDPGLANVVNEGINLDDFEI